MRVTDEELLESLAAAFRPQTVEPPASRIDAFRSVVEDRFAEPRGRLIPFVKTGIRRSSALVAAGGLVLGGATAAAAATGHLPQPIRAFAHGLGIGAPKQHPSLATRLAELRDALRHHDYATADALVRTLEGKAAHLSAEERAHLSGTVDTMLTEAGRPPAHVDEAVVQPEPAGAGHDSPGTVPDTSAPSSSDVPTTEPAPDPPTTAPPGPSPTTETTTPPDTTSAPDAGPAPSDGSANPPAATPDRGATPST